MRRNYLLPIIAILGLFVSALGCGVCPLLHVPGPTATPTSVPSGVSPTLAPTSTPPPAAETPTPTLRTVSRLVSYTNASAGFSIEYPRRWMYQEDASLAGFAPDEAALLAFDPGTGPFLIIQAGSPGEILEGADAPATPEEFLDQLLVNLTETELNTFGEPEAVSFGGTPGMLAEVSWIEPTGEVVEVHGYVLVALGDDVAGIGLAISSDAEWGQVGPTFEQMLDTLEFFPPAAPSLETQGQLVPGETVRGTLPLEGVDVWTFEAEAGQYASLRMNAEEEDGLDPYMELYDEEGLVAENDDAVGRDAAIVDFPIEATGVYTVYATSYQGQGAYRLTLEMAEEPSGGGEIAYGEAVEADLPGGGQHSWTFEGEADEVVTIRMEALEPELDAFLSLYGPDGELLTEDDDSGLNYNPLIETYRLPEDGIYRIAAASSWASGSGGQYLLSIELTELDVQGALEYDEMIEASLDTADLHHWLFEGSAGDEVTIRMTSDEFDGYLELFAPNGVRIAENDDADSEDPVIGPLVLEMDGTYRIIARGFADEDAGVYELELVGP